MEDTLRDLLNQLERIPKNIVWTSFIPGAMYGGLMAAGIVKRWYGILFILIGVPALFVGLSLLVPPGLLPGYTLMFYVVGIAVIIGIGVYIN